MFIKGLSKTASALALVGVVAPFIAQSVGAADTTDNTSALKDVAGVTDYSGSEILNSAAVSDANGSGTASGLSHAGIGFESGDLILYQVPNFDFKMNNKIADATYPMLKGASDGKSRMAVIVDNRYTKKGSKISDTQSYNWKLTASASPFSTSDSSKLTNADASLLLNDGDKVKAVKAISQNAKGQPLKDYMPGTEDAIIALGKNVDILADGPHTVAQSDSGNNPGAVGIDFADPNSAEFVVKAEGITNIIPNQKYVSNITWTLTASPLH